jgi:hypothetical protein
VQQLTIPLTTALPAGWTFTRSGATATYWQNGTLIGPVAANVPRFESDANGNLLGYLNEPAATNIYLNSQAPATQTITVTAQAYTLSFYGTGAIALTGTYTGTLTGTGAANLVQLTFTPTAGSLITTLTGTVTNVQLEAGSFATSRIITAGSAVTRNADNLSAPLSLYPWMKGNAGTIVVRVTPTGFIGLARIFEINDGTANNYIYASSNTTQQTPETVYFNYAVSGTAHANNSVGSMTVGIAGSVGISWSHGIANNGLASGIVSPFSSSNYPVPSGSILTTIGVGNRAYDGARPFAGHFLYVTLAGAAMPASWMIRQ